MDLKTTIPESFLNLFYREIECSIPETHSKLSLHILKIENNKFCYDELIDELTDHLIPFALSRRTIDDFKRSNKLGQLNKKAISRFRKYNENKGEAGELLLFCFLEAHLKAPKVLTKLEIKLNSDDYAKGSDGVHLLKIAERKFQLIFGESKLDENLTNSISNAFKSIYEFINRDKNNVSSEIGLINSQLNNETFEEGLYQFLKSVIVPSARGESPIEKDNAFAIFAGFEFEPTNEEEKMSNDAFRISVKERIRREVENRMEHIQKKIVEYKLHGYTFYVYVFPFLKLDDARSKIIKKITLAD